MAEFAYNNAKNPNTSYTPFEFNCGYHSKVLFEEDVNPYLRSRYADKLAKKRKELIEVYYQNLLIQRSCRRELTIKEQRVIAILRVRKSS